MNIAVIKHQPDALTNYLFSAPEGVKLKAGDCVLCKTQYGEAFGTLVYDSFEVEGAAYEAILKAYKATELKPIVGVYELASFEEKTESAREIEIAGHHAKEVTVTMKAQITEIIKNPDADPYIVAKVTAADYAQIIKNLCNVDDVVVTELKVFIHDEQENV